MVSRPIYRNRYIWYARFRGNSTESIQHSNRNTNRYYYNAFCLGSSNNMAYGAVRWSDGITVTKGSNFTELVNISVSSNYAFDVEYAKNQTAVNWTWGSESGTSVAMAIEIK